MPEATRLVQRVRVIQDRPFVLSDEVVLIPDQAASVFRQILGSEAQEVVGVLMFDTPRRCIGYIEISRGTINESHVHPREVFRSAIQMGANSIVVAHNHPSGVLEQSDADVSVGRTLVKAGRILGINVDDMLIVSANGDNSATVNGWLHVA